MPARLVGLAEPLIVVEGLRWDLGPFLPLLRYDRSAAQVAGPEKAETDSRTPTGRPVALRDEHP